MRELLDSSETAVGAGAASAVGKNTDDDDDCGLQSLACTATITSRTTIIITYVSIIYGVCAECDGVITATSGTAVAATEGASSPGDQPPPKHQ